MAKIITPTSIHMPLFVKSKKFIVPPEDLDKYNFLLKAGQNIVTGIKPLPQNQRKPATINFTPNGFPILFFCDHNQGEKYVVKPVIFVDTVNTHGNYPMISFYALITRGMSKYVDYGQLRSAYLDEIGGDIYQAVQNKY